VTGWDWIESVLENTEFSIGVLSELKGLDWMGEWEEREEEQV